MLQLVDLQEVEALPCVLAEVHLGLFKGIGCCNAFGGRLEGHIVVVRSNRLSRYPAQPLQVLQVLDIYVWIGQLALWAELVVLILVSDRSHLIRGTRARLPVLLLEGVEAVLVELVLAVLEVSDACLL